LVETGVVIKNKNGVARGGGGEEEKGGQFKKLQ
jgi:hypothetical protein